MCIAAFKKDARVEKLHFSAATLRMVFKKQVSSSASGARQQAQHRIGYKLDLALCTWSERETQAPSLEPPPLPGPSNSSI
mmetsp:Transcript_8006/g.10436  ORF Transcript_8006/g.10436 Transcript_8006/m.10436 type:complete len:80 (+) Transcript_8006:61-300(+)